MMTNPTTNVAGCDLATVIRDTVARTNAARPHVGDIGDHGEVFVVPEGHDLRVVDVREHEEFPRRKEGVFPFVGVRSFSKYVARYRTADTLAWVRDLFGAGVKAFTYDTRLVEVVFDDLPSDGETGGSNRAHRAVLVLRPTAAARRWGRVLDQTIDQETLIDLVTDGISEIAEPPAADLQDLARDLHSIRTTAVSQVVRTGGEGKIELSENVELRAGRGRSVTFPEAITLVLTPFAAHADTFTLTVRVKAKVVDGRVLFGLAAPDLDEHLARLTGEIADEVHESTGLEPLWTQ